MSLSMPHGNPLRRRPPGRKPKRAAGGAARLLCLIGVLGVGGCLSLPPEPRFTDAEIGKVLGGNVLRALRTIWV